MAAAPQSDAEQPRSSKPLWELGAGAGFAGYADFRGSNQYNFIGAPVPIVIYRGDWLAVSRDDTHARVFDSRRFDINITGGGTLPANSNRANGRENMPDLDLTFSVGPSFDWILSDPRNRASRLRFRLPVRAAFAASFHTFKSLGWVVEPQLVYDHRWLVNDDNSWSVTLRAGPRFAGNRYNDYYYRVKTKYAVAGRRAYDASAGYSGTQASVGLVHQRGRLSLGSYASLDYLAGATFADSPLVATEQSYRVGAYVAWYFWQSETRAPVRNLRD